MFQYITLFFYNIVYWLFYVGCDVIFSTSLSIVYAMCSKIVAQMYYNLLYIPYHCIVKGKRTKITLIK